MKQKKFMIIDELIENIKNKGIKIKNEKKLKQILEYNNYYYITGYKNPFKTSDGTYKSNVYFEDIYAIYILDKKLKKIFAEVLLDIEQKVKTVFINNFCQRYGFKKENLLSSSNYDLKNKNLPNCLKKLRQQVNVYGKENEAVIYYEKKYLYVPIWVLMKVLTFSMIRDLILCSTSDVKGYISKKIVNDKSLKVSEVMNMLELLVHVRNCCCHDDKIYGFRDMKVSIKNTQYHNCFSLKKNKKGEYLQGKKDLLAVLICIKYFLNENSYSNFIDNIYNLIQECSNQIKSISKKEILDYMFLPSDFKKLKNS